VPADPPRPQLVLVHGSRLSSAQWLPQLPLLEPHVGVRLVDLPGHGSRAGEAFTLDRCVEVVGEAVGQAAARGPVVLVGHSLGGYVAMDYAARHGETLAGLVLAGASARPQGAGARAYRVVGWLTDRIGAERMTRVNDGVLHRLYPPERIDPVIAGGYWFAPTTTAWREVMEECRPVSLARLACPVLVLNGRWDQFRLGVPGFRHDVPAARVETIRGAGHLANLDQPEAFADALLRFAREVADSAHGA
jgi:pimeloyl-ACP methyl ester carboxylesterase